MVTPVADADTQRLSWAERAAQRSPSVERSRVRSVLRASQVLEAAHKLISEKGADFTAVELAKEAGIAVQTFYKHFGSKDQVLLAVLEQMIATTCEQLVEDARDLVDPVARLRSHVVGLALNLRVEGEVSPVSRFVATEHWRLQQVHPVALASAIRPVSQLLQDDLASAVEAGVLAPTSVEYDSWLVMMLVVAVFHHYTFSPVDKPAEEIAEGLWAFCFGAWGGRTAPTPPKATGRRHKEN